MCCSLQGSLDTGRARQLFLVFPRCVIMLSPEPLRVPRLINKTCSLLRAAVKTPLNFLNNRTYLMRMLLLIQCMLEEKLKLQRTSSPVVPLSWANSFNGCNCQLPDSVFSISPPFNEASLWPR